MQKIFTQRRISLAICLEQVDLVKSYRYYLPTLVHLLFIFAFIFIIFCLLVSYCLLLLLLLLLLILFTAPLVTHCTIVHVYHARAR